MTHMTTQPSKPSNWQNGFTAPHQLASGEEPFYCFGTWYLYVRNTEINDLEVYDFSTDLMISYEDFQKFLSKNNSWEW